MSHMIPQLLTERLFLNEITEMDTPFLVAWRSDPEIYRYFLTPRPLKPEEHLAWFWETYLPDENCCQWMAAEKDSGTPIGVFGIKKNAFDRKVGNISYLLDPQAQGKGYAAEAVECILNFALETGFCNCAAAEIHIENQASLRFAENLGFTYTGRTGDFAFYKRRL